jgi:hypothetical protein
VDGVESIPKISGRDALQSLSPILVEKDWYVVTALAAINTAEAWCVRTGQGKLANRRLQ